MHPRTHSGHRSLNGVSPDVVVTVEQRAHRYHVHRDAEQLSELLFEMDEVEQRTGWLELHRGVTEVLEPNGAAGRRGG